MKEKLKYSQANKQTLRVFINTKSALQGIKGVLSDAKGRTPDNNLKPYEEIQINNKSKYTGNITANVTIFFITSDFYFSLKCIKIIINLCLRGINTYKYTFIKKRYKISLKSQELILNINCL